MVFRKITKNGLVEMWKSVCGTTWRVIQRKSNSKSIDTAHFENFEDAAEVCKDLELGLISLGVS